MTTIILDDEQPAIKILSSFIEKIPFLHLHLATTNAFEAIQHLNDHDIDLMFLDIEMPDITGVELLKSLESKPKVIFTTAYEKYALQGYELDIIDYLVKPIRFERFLKAANKAYNLHQLSQHPSTSPKEEYLTLKVDYKNIKVKLSDIEYIEGLKDYVKIYTTEGMLVPRLNLKAIAAKLPADEFIRVHRSFIVAQSKVTSYQKGQLFLGQKAIPVGITYQEKLMNRFS
jgi:DNA-binding LytR/AlgR family response regulator